VRITTLGTVLLCCLAALPAGLSKSEFVLQSAIVFVSTRDNLTIDPNASAEIYIMNGDGTDPQRLTDADGTGKVQVTKPPGLNLFPNWGEVREHVKP
jgi:hypothetical protein